MFWRNIGPIFVPIHPAVALQYVKRSSFGKCTFILILTFLHFETNSSHFSSLYFKTWNGSNCFDKKYLNNNLNQSAEPKLQIFSEWFRILGCKRKGKELLVLVGKINRSVWVPPRSQTPLHCFHLLSNALDGFLLIFAGDIFKHSLEISSNICWKFLVRKI